MDRRFKIKTLGCKVNQYESQVIRERLISAGYHEAEGDREAGLCIVNTCTVTAKADKESREALRRFIRENPRADIIAAGCYCEKDADTIKSIDSRIRILSNRDKQDIGTGTAKQGITYFKGYTKAFIKVQEGCNNFCSYCKVPYVRGRSRSREEQAVLREADNLISNGYKELVLTGICLGDYGKELKSHVSLARLAKNVSDINGDFRLRLSSIELQDITDELIDTMAFSGKLCRHFHVSLQSGDNHILNKMNRRYAREEFIERIMFIRSRMPDIGITTDVIIGFPQESEDNFNNTLDVLRSIRPSRTHIFTYSPRRGTKAFETPDTVSPAEKSRRYGLLKGITDKFAEEFKLSSYNKAQRILVETARDNITGSLTGYTDTYVKMLIEGPDEYMGKLIDYHTRPHKSFVDRRKRR